MVRELIVVRQAEQALSERRAEFTVVDGLVLTKDRLTPGAKVLARHLRRCRGDAGAAEYLVNRRFVLAHLLNNVLGQPLSAFFRATPEGCEIICRVADSYAANLREGLRREFPDRAFEVEVVGAEDSEDEPAEVCVTFFRTD